MNDAIYPFLKEENIFRLDGSKKLKTFKDRLESKLKASKNIMWIEFYCSE